jgi:hypothetical protein
MATLNSFKLSYFLCDQSFGRIKSVSLLRLIGMHARFQLELRENKREATSLLSQNNPPDLKCFSYYRLSPHLFGYKTNSETKIILFWDMTPWTNVSKEHAASILSVQVARKTNGLWYSTSLVYTTDFQAETVTGRHRCADNSADTIYLPGLVNCYWPSSAQSFFVPSPAGLSTVFYCITTLRAVELHTHEHTHPRARTHTIWR